MEENALASKLIQSISAIEKLENEVYEIKLHVKDIFTDLKNGGFDIKAIKQVLKLRKMDKEDLEQLDFFLHTYRKFLKME